MRARAPRRSCEPPSARGPPAPAPPPSAAHAPLGRARPPPASPPPRGAGEKPNSPRADCTLARAALTHTQLDDGAPKRVRIVLEPSRYEREAGAAESALGSMRLMVYVADLHDSAANTQVRARARPLAAGAASCAAVLPH